MSALTPTAEWLAAELASIDAARNLAEAVKNVVAVDKFAARTTLPKWCYPILARLKVQTREKADAAATRARRLHLRALRLERATVGPERIR